MSNCYGYPQGQAIPHSSLVAGPVSRSVYARYAQRPLLALLLAMPLLLHTRSTWFVLLAVASRQTTRSIVVNRVDHNSQHLCHLLEPLLAALEVLSRSVGLATLQISV